MNIDPFSNQQLNELKLMKFRQLMIWAILYFIVFLWIYGYEKVQNEKAGYILGSLALIGEFLYFRFIFYLWSKNGLALLLENHSGTLIIAVTQIVMFYFLNYIVILIFFDVIYRAVRQSILNFSFEYERANPSLFLIFGFISIIIIGSYLLTLPVMTHDSPLGFIDAFFTATSATCVTGLIVVDTATRFTMTGQWVILFLIEIGGLGIMTVSSFILILIGQRFSLKNMEILKGIYDIRESRQLIALIKKVIFYTFSIELFGCLLLYLRARTYSQVQNPLFFSLFHSISAFCNAGFALQTDNLMPFAQDPLLNFTIMGLIVLGGLGFIVINNVLQFFYKHQRLLLHSRLILYGTSILICLGFVLFFFLEFGGVLDQHYLSNKMLISLFQSISARTAGFNTIDFSQIGNMTKLLFIGLMFIGAGPGSAAGGVKITTLIVIIGFAYQTLMENPKLTFYQRTISAFIVAKSIVIVILSIFFIVIIFISLEMTQTFSMLDLLFETVSAFGTVGLSTGITPGLTSFGKIMITLLMFVGRVGPLSFSFLIRPGKAKPVLVKFPDEDVWVG